MYLEEAKKRAEDLYCLTKSELVPCTLEDVKELENWCGHRLPEAYQEFLLWMGRDGGTFLRGSNCFYHDLESLKSSAISLLEEDQSVLKMPENAFVFLYASRISV